MASRTLYHHGAEIYTLLSIESIAKGLLSPVSDKISGNKKNSSFGQKFQKITTDVKNRGFEYYFQLNLFQFAKETNIRQLLDNQGFSSHLICFFRSNCHIYANWRYNCFHRRRRK